MNAPCILDTSRKQILFLYALDRIITALIPKIKISRRKIGFANENGLKTGLNLIFSNAKRLISKTVKNKLKMADFLKIDETRRYFGPAYILPEVINTTANCIGYALSRVSKFSLAMLRLK